MSMAPKCFAVRLTTLWRWDVCCVPSPALSVTYIYFDSTRAFPCNSCQLFVLKCDAICHVAQCCRPVREYAKGSTCITCHAECQPLNSSASCHGPVRSSGDIRLFSSPFIATFIFWVYCFNSCISWLVLSGRFFFFIFLNSCLTLR